ncbi:MAG: hypothetical protein QNJ37_14440 [Crocosphaera sp.]|nr:hypothetical protein [Crocosphaera sp.]
MTILLSQHLEGMINPETWDRFKNKVKGEGKTINEVVNELIDAYLANINQINSDELDKAIANHPTIQSMKRDIENLDSYLDGLTRAIKDMKEVKPTDKKSKHSAISHQPSA